MIFLTIPKMTKWILVGLCCFWPTLLSGQAESLPQSVYASRLQQMDLISHGKSYEHLYAVTKGHQYLVGPILKPARLVVDGIHYEDVMLNYDIHNDYVILGKNLDALPIYIILPQERIDAFTLEGFSFIHIKDSSYQNLDPGIYQLAYASEQFRLLVRRKKLRVRELQLVTEGKTERFVEKTHYFLLKGQQAFSFSNKKKLMEILGHTEAVKAFLKQEKIKLKPKQDRYLEYVGQVLGFVDSL